MKKLINKNTGVVHWDYNDFGRPECETKGHFEPYTGSKGVTCKKCKFILKRYYLYLKGLEEQEERKVSIFIPFDERVNYVII